MIGATVSHFKVVEKSRDREIQISGHRFIVRRTPLGIQWADGKINK